MFCFNLQCVTSLAMSIKGDRSSGVAVCSQGGLRHLSSGLGPAEGGHHDRVDHCGMVDRQKGPPAEHSEAVVVAALAAKTCEKPSSFQERTKSYNANRARRE
eukprot:scaffold211240_cov33-Prasinocladus_malaysianus.AAC.1